MFLSKRKIFDMVIPLSKILSGIFTFLSSQMYPIVFSSLVLGENEWDCMRMKLIELCMGWVYFLSLSLSVCDFFLMRYKRYLMMNTCCWCTYGWHDHFLDLIPRKTVDKIVENHYISPSKSSSSQKKDKKLIPSPSPVDESSSSLEELRESIAPSLPDGQVCKT